MNNVHDNQELPDPTESSQKKVDTVAYNSPREHRYQIMRYLVKIHSCCGNLKQKIHLMHA